MNRCPGAIVLLVMQSLLLSTIGDALAQDLVGTWHASKVRVASAIGGYSFLTFEIVVHESGDVSWRLMEDLSEPEDGKGYAANDSVLMENFLGDDVTMTAKVQGDEAVLSDVEQRYAVRLQRGPSPHLALGLQKVRPCVENREHVMERLNRFRFRDIGTYGVDYLRPENVNAQLVALYSAYRAGTGVVALKTATLGDHSVHHTYLVVADGVAEVIHHVPFDINQPEWAWACEVVDIRLGVGTSDHQGEIVEEILDVTKPTVLLYRSDDPASFFPPFFTDADRRRGAYNYAIDRSAQRLREQVETVGR